MQTQYIFIDETGTSETQVDPQEFFCIGFLKIADPSVIGEQLLLKMFDNRAAKRTERRDILTSLENKATLSREQLSRFLMRTSHLEYKFAHVSYYNVETYKAFIDTACTFPFSFYGVILNKSRLSRASKEYTDYWSTYIHHVTKTLEKLKANDKQLIVIADYMSKPGTAEDSFEQAVNRIPGVVGALRTHSSSFPLLQLTDLLIGGTAYRFRKEHGSLKQSKRAAAKDELATYIVQKLTESHHELVIETL